MTGALRIAASIGYLAALLALGCGTAGADVVDHLYRARTIVTGQGEPGRSLGLAECLEQVLVKVSGDPRLLGDPRGIAMAKQAASFVADLSYRDRMAGIPIHDEQGSRDRPFDLIVNFEPGKIDAALRSLGRAPWSAPRPRLVVFLGVRLGATTYLLAGDGARGRDQREALAAAAERFGMPMALPDQAALAKAGLSYQDLPVPDLPRLDATARTLGGHLALAGNMVWNEQALGWVADWRLGSRDESYGWQVRGVGFDDAFRNAMAGAAQILSGNGRPDQATP